MPLEVGTTLDILNAAWPEDGINDDADEGWAHINLIKDILKKQFPGVGLAGYARALQITEDELNYLVGVISPLQAQIDALQGTTVAVGDILMFSGLLNTLPTNFKLCNGANGTPNLTNRFIMGVNIDGDIGNTGGNNNSATISHNHATGHNHSQTTSNTGAHTHVLDGAGNGATKNVLYDLDGSGNGIGIATNTLEDNTHRHTVTVNSTTVNISTDGGSVTEKNAPPYYKLAYIQRVT